MVVRQLFAAMERIFMPAPVARCVARLTASIAELLAKLDETGLKLPADVTLDQAS